MATKIHKIMVADVATGESVVREMNEQELADYNGYLLQVSADTAKKKAETDAKAAAKAAAQSKLAALGLTVEDLQALGL